MMQAVLGLYLSALRQRSSLWPFSLASDKDELELTSKRALRSVYSDQNSTNEELIKRVGQCPLNNIRIQDRFRPLMHAPKTES